MASFRLALDAKLSGTRRADAASNGDRPRIEKGARAGFQGSAMIRPLRRRHRSIIPALLLVLVVLAVFAATHPAKSSPLERLPAELLPQAESAAHR
jgi:hypothetical protein